MSTKASGIKFLRPPSFGCNRQLYPRVQRPRIARSARDPARLRSKDGTARRRSRRRRPRRARDCSTPSPASGSWCSASCTRSSASWPSSSPAIRTTSRPTRPARCSRSRALRSAECCSGSSRSGCSRCASGSCSRRSWCRVGTGLAAGRAASRSSRRRLAYAVVGVLALVFALGGRPSAAESGYDVSATLIAVPGGAWLLIAVGLATLGVGIGFVVAGVRRRFRRLLRMPSGAAGRSSRSSAWPATSARASPWASSACSW